MPCLKNTVGQAAPAGLNNQQLGLPVTLSAQENRRTLASDLRRQSFIRHPEQLITVFEAAGFEAFAEPVRSLC